MSSAMQQLDGYKVEVLYLLNPHLIWVEVRDPAIVFDDNEIKFEQIGIYGMLPSDTAIAVEEVTSIQRCEDWVPAAATRVWEFLENEEVFFTPIHLDQRSSIFDDNVHKFGDLVVKKKNGKIRSIIKVLKNTGFATYDVCMFHQYLSLGKINTKLSNIETQNVITELKKYFIRRKVPKNKWEDPIKRQTSVFRASCDLEEALTTTNLDKHKKAILDGKNKDLELCKRSDEPSSGRGSTRKVKEKKKSALEKRLELMKNRKAKNGLIDSDTAENGTNDHLQGFEDTKIFQEANGASYSKKIYSKADAQKAQILSKVMNKSAKKVSKQEKLVNRLLNESREKRERKKSDDVVEKAMNLTDESISCSGQVSTSISNQSPEQEDILNKGKKADETNCVSDGNQILETVEVATSISKSVENVVDKNDNHIVNSYETQITESYKMPSTKPKQEPSVKIEENVVEITNNEDQVGTNVTNNVDYYRHRRSTRGKSKKKGGKASKAGLKVPLSQIKRKDKNCSTSPLPKLAYPSRSRIRDADANNSRRVPDLPVNRVALSTKPVSEKTVKRLMSTFNLTDSLHCEMIQSAIRKCKGGGKNNSDAIAALVECKNIIMDEIKEHEDSKNLANIHVDVPLMQTLSKKKLKKKAKKQNVNNGKNKIANGSPGIDTSALSRVPPVVLYDEEAANNDNQAILNRDNNTVDGDCIVDSGLDNDLSPSCNGVGQEKEIKNKRNDPRQEKDKSASSSSMWEKRLKLHKEMSKNKRSATYNSDRICKVINADEKTPPKNFIKQNTDEDSDDSVSDIVEKLGIGYNSYAPNVNTNKKSNECNPSERTVQANPFQNYDIRLSIFVDELVTPVMTVHSKMTKDFVPTTSCRDTHFTDHIRSVLKNLHIYHPTILQSISWNAILRGCSVFMIGSTLSGKTMGYLPAVCRHVSDYHHSEPFSDSVGPFCIIVCATCHSVAEVERTAKMLLGCDEKVVACHYGYDEVAIAASLLNGCDLLVTTAPSLVRLLQMPDYGLDLQRLVTFVLDDCERLSKVYPNEIKYCLHNIREMIKSRMRYGLFVQYIVASRIWCDFMESFAKKAPDTVLCIGAFQESVLYAKANMIVSSVKNDGKLNRLFEFLKDVDTTKKTVVVCNSDEEVDYLNRAIQTNKYFIFATNESMTVQDLHNLTLLWNEFREPMVAPVLICHDTNLYNMNIVDATYLVQYSLPSRFDKFCRRFTTLNKNYPSIFKPDYDDDPIIKILILLDENDVEELPKMIQFIKRCTNSIPESLDVVSAAMMAEKDIRKAKCYVSLCPSLMSFGECPELYNCHSRHSILKDYDKPKEWMPKSGIVTFKILHYHNATFYSARLIGNFDAGTRLKYPSTYSHMLLTMGMHYAKHTNRIAFDNPKVGDICAVALRDNFFCRAQVLRIGDHRENVTVKNVLVYLLDEEIMEKASELDLYHLPDDFKREETYVVQVRLANIQPRDKDLVFSQLAIDEIRETISVEKNLYMKGQIVLTVGNCIFVDTLEACQDLKSLNETVVFYNVKRELLEKHAEINPDHVSKLEELCRKSELESKPAEKLLNESSSKVKDKPEISWANLADDITMVGFGAVVNPSTLFVRLNEYEDCVKPLLTDIQRHVANNTANLEDFEKDDIVLAEYPNDCFYERARIDEIGDKDIKCFFVDRGQWRQIDKGKLKSISETLITQYPFQAIECRLVGIQPVGDQWTDFATNWLFDRCSESGASKQLYVKYYTKELAQYTGGHKYGVAVIDTYGEEDIVLNQLMIDLDLAKEVNDEVKYLEKGNFKYVCKTCKETEEDDESWEDVSKYSSTSDSTPKKAITQPIRSVPLLETDEDSDDSEKWNINRTEDTAAMFEPSIETSTQHTTLNVPAITNNTDEILEELEEVDTLSNKIKYCSYQHDEEKINPDPSKELDSDDLSSPETAHSITETSEKDDGSITLNEYQMREPKLSWRQTRTSVTIKIQVIGADNYNLQVHDRALAFAATVNETQYAFEFELYGVINKKTAMHSNKGQHILVKLNKIMHKNWLTLTKDGGIRKWIVYDVDSIDNSSDEEEVQKDNLYNFKKYMDSNTDSDSDDEVNYEAADDVSFKYKNYE